MSLIVPAAGMTFPVKIGGLARNTTYTFGVTATNAFGTGPASAKKLTGAVTTATVTPAKVRYGQQVTVSGKVTNADTGKPLSGQTVYLYARTKGTSSYVPLRARATSAADGSYSLVYGPKASRRYYVSSRGPSTMGASSPSTYVPLKGRATLVLSDSSVTAGTKVIFSGKAKPGNGSRGPAAAPGGLRLGDEEVRGPGRERLLRPDLDALVQDGLHLASEGLGAELHRGRQRQQGPEGHLTPRSTPGQGGRQNVREGSGPGDRRGGVLEDAGHVGEEA